MGCNLELVEHTSYGNHSVPLLSFLADDVNVRMNNSYVWFDIAQPGSVSDRH